MSIEAPIEADEETDVAEAHREEIAGHSDAVYVKVFAVLVVATALEVYASYAGWLGPALTPVLLVGMVIKFVLVVLFFMHLRDDSKVFSFMFWSGLVLAVAVYLITLATFQLFT